MIKRLLRMSAILAFVPVVSAAAGTAVTHAAGCTLTGFSRDGMNLTAAVINPSGTFRGTVNASGCNIGIYYGPGSQGTVSHSEVYGANYFGIVNNGGNVNIDHSSVHDIGEKPFNGTQHGVGIYFAYGNVETGTISQNSVYRYQKGGIVVNGAGTSATVDHNTVTGLGPVDFIAQNGIQFGYGSTGTASHNTVSGNSYTGSNFAASGGILLVGGACYGSPTTSNVTIDHNTLTGNDVGAYLSNLDASCNPASTPTNDVVSHNDITDNAVNNTTGWDGNTGYQAGISDQGDQDVLDHNNISGVGYTPVAPPPHLYCIDDTATNNVVESHNSCG